jgi:hypothetical protein
VRENKARRTKALSSGEVVAK